MNIHLGLMRGINVTGHNRVLMADLRALLTGLGCIEVQTVLQSGNVVFRHSLPSGLDLECWLENETRKQLNVQTDFMVRSAAEWQEIIAKNPFPLEAKRDPARLTVVLLKASVAAKDVESLRKSVAGPERIGGVGRHIYIFYPNGIGSSLLTTALIDRKLGTRGTARNWNTVLKLGSLSMAYHG